jgi:hypothetical protein
MAGIGLPHGAIRDQVRRGVDLVVHLVRDGEGARSVVALGEVTTVAAGVGVREVWTR